MKSIVKITPPHKKYVLAKAIKQTIKTALLGGATLLFLNGTQVMAQCFTCTQTGNQTVSPANNTSFLGTGFDLTVRGGNATGLDPASGGDLFLQAGTGGGQGNVNIEGNNIFLTPTSNVGIGTTVFDNASLKLQVEGGNIGQVISGTIGGDNVGDQWATVGGPFTGAPAFLQSYYGFKAQRNQYGNFIGLKDENAVISFSSGTTVQNRLIFESVDQNNAPTERMTILQNGNVGIGTNNPFNKLHVSGGYVRLDQNNGNDRLLLIGNEPFLRFQEIFSGDQIFDFKVENSNLNIYGGDGLGVSQRVQITKSGNVGIGNNADSRYRLLVDGDFRVNGTPSTNAGLWETSDRQFKKEITPEVNASEKLMQLRPVTYYFNDKEAYSKINFDRERLQHGLIAQELQQVFPEMVRETTMPAIYDTLGQKVQDEVDYLAVNYDGLITMLVAALQEQNNLNQQQQAAIEVLKNGGSSKVLSEERNINNSQDVYLRQNRPNPFSDRTVIEYGLPEQYSRAELWVLDLTGKKITGKTLTERGQVEIMATELTSTGIYVYALVVDGQVLVTEKMIVE